MYLAIYLTVYSLLILLYAAVKTFKWKRLRFPVKCSLAAMFFGLSVFGAVTANDPLFVVISVALFFAATGDVFLLFAQRGRKYFHAGVVAFGICNAILIVACVLRFGFYWFSIPIIVVCELANILLQLKNIINYGKSKILLNIYMPLVGISGVFGLCVVLAGVGGIGGILFGIGTLLFFISDILLGIFNFVVKKWQIDALNSLFYFSGTMLIALSLIF